jgi:hypothetical protein
LVFCISGHAFKLPLCVEPTRENLDLHNEAYHGQNHIFRDGNVSLGQTEKRVHACSHIFISVLTAGLCGGATAGFRCDIPSSGR